ncbi:MAG: hypothetical protein FJ217_13435 [Ignavibacteria bacterium]|nr:hypothetical protein [Ignavibacteria bacterium]
MMMTAQRRIRALILPLFFGLGLELAVAQVESPVLSFNRGMLWQSVFFGKIGPNFSNWGRRGIGLDWPGFDETWIREDIGGAPSHMVTGGLWIGAKKANDSVLTVEDWSMYGGTVSNEPNVKYRVTKHTLKYKNGENYWLKSAPLEGEEVIETVWEYNLNYSNVDDRERQLPVRVRRTAHQWSGSRRDENYVIYEYIIKNISPELRAAGRAVADTLYGLHLLLNYGLQVNSRAWSVLFPSLTPGARNTWFFYDAGRRMIWGRAADYPETVANEDYSFSNSQGPVKDGKPSGEWLAPGFVGVRLLYASPDQTGEATRVNRYGWSAGSNSIDLSGPFTGIGTNEAKYAVVSNLGNAANFVSSSADTTYMRRSRMWSMMTLGPWKLLPGDSITVAIAEFVDGVDYRYAVDPATSPSFLGSRGAQIFFATADKAKFTYDQRLAGKGYNHPDPPAAPKFTVDFYREKERSVANVLRWGIEAETVNDPDDGTNDLAGYRVYRSSFLPIGPWDSVGTVLRRDLKYFNPANNGYTFVDSTVLIGTSYYYAVTAFDTGKVSWPVNPSSIFPETRSTRVPALESSIFANRTTTPFKATIPPLLTTNEILVVPNPYVIGEGFSQPGETDQIQFVNLPNPCTIRIYTVRGDLVKTIQVGEGSGAIASWNQVTDFGQFVESGVYIFHVDSPVGSKIGKFAIVR